APKVILGHFWANRMRDIYSTMTSLSNHGGEDTKSYPEGTRAHSRAEWYVMQVETSNNFEVPFLISVLCGGLNYQIEHHLFPHFPTNRLREIAPQVKAICEDYGIDYRTSTWGERLHRVFNHLYRLNLDDLQ